VHGDDTTVPVMAKGKTDTGRLWIMSGMTARSAAPIRRRWFSIIRATGAGTSPVHLASWSGILQADAYAGYFELYAPNRQPGLILRQDALLTREVLRTC
jgi:hypothetical protein